MTFPEKDIPEIIAAIQQLTDNVRLPDGMPHCSEFVEYMHTRTAGLTPEHAHEVQIPNAVPLSYIAVLEIIGKLADLMNPPS